MQVVESASPFLRVRGGEGGGYRFPCDVGGGTKRSGASANIEDAPGEPGLVR